MGQLSYIWDQMQGNYIGHLDLVFLFTGLSQRNNLRPYKAPTSKYNDVIPN